VIPARQEGLADETNRAVDGAHKEPNRYGWVMPWATGTAALVAGLLIVAVAYAVVNGAEKERLLAFGYPGLALVMFFSSATVLLPAPGLAAVLAGSGIGQLNPWLVGFFAGLGGSLGELTGYLVGIGGREMIHQHPNRWVVRFERLMRGRSFIAILLLAAIPNPVFDAVGLIGGSLGYSARRFWLACLIGNTIKCTYIALLGGTAIGWFIHD
jgi:membrane protein YqaA with SNARE-associated domain